MAKSKKDKPDINVTAFEILKAVTDIANQDQTKNPAAVALGRLGGQKGGPARAQKLSAIKRKQIAKKAAQARWLKKSD